VTTFLSFFVAIFYEARACLLSVMEINEPKILASSLRKIGGSTAPNEGSCKAEQLATVGYPPSTVLSHRMAGEPA
jgi:hypothetical protein